MESRREEWEVTGDPGHGFPHYRFVFGTNSEALSAAPGSTAEQRAREFIAFIVARGGWPDGPRLRHRVVIETEWIDDRG